ncbi:MAG TPA: hypothetical protein VFV50_05745 [Bdellovibrionales bacterium]|nr:hypothetical protein [Bdellovibrionales bacterium]
MFSVLLKALWLAAFSTSVGFNKTSSQSVSLKRELSPYVRAYDLTTIDGLFGQLKTLQNLKGPEGFPHFDERAAWADTANSIPEPISRRFREMNRVVFGQEGVVDLVPADGDLSALHKPGRKIGFPRELLKMKANDKVQMDFTLAHALSHYIHELYIVKYSRDARSPHGNPSRSHDGSLSESADSAAAHAEVDAIAVAILLKMGHDSKALQTALSADFMRSKHLVDDTIGMNVNELTSFKAIPREFHGRIRDNYIRLVSMIYTLYTWKQKQQNADADKASL